MVSVVYYTMNTVEREIANQLICLTNAESTADITIPIEDCYRIEIEVYGEDVPPIKKTFYFGLKGNLTGFTEFKMWPDDS